VLIASKYSMLEYNISKQDLRDAEKITPGYDSPTISSLDQKDFFAVKVMVSKSEIIGIMDSLEKIGASAIIETEINNCRL